MSHSVVNVITSHRVMCVIIFFWLVVAAVAGPLAGTYLVASGRGLIGAGHVTAHPEETKISSRLGMPLDQRR